MMDGKLAKEVLNALKAAEDKPKAYDTTAEVRRVDGDTLWVHIPGGVDETPVSKTINASPGDTIQVRVSGGRAFAVGNATAPPTDDKAAIAVLDKLNANWAKIDTAIINTLEANGINADWINTGALIITDDDGNEIFRADKSGRTFKWDMAMSSLGTNGKLELRDNGEDSSASLKISNSTGLLDTTELSSFGLKYNKFGTGMRIGYDSTNNKDTWYWGQATSKIFELIKSTTTSGLTINDKTLEQWIAKESGVAFKTGTITIPSGTSGTVDTVITFGGGFIPDGKTAYGIQVVLSTNPLPYVNASGQVVTWVKEFTNTDVTISNKTSAWTNYNYYITVFFH